MAATMTSQSPIALLGAPNGDVGSKHSTASLLQPMHVEIAQDIVDDLLQSLTSGKLPQIFFGRTPQLKYGDKTHVLHTTPETHPHELYKPTGSVDGTLEFAGLIRHTLTVQPAENVTAGVDSALEQLRNSMAAISDLKEANKTIVGTTTTAGSSSHPTRFRANLVPSKTGSPRLSGPPSPMGKRPPTSQPSSSRDMVLGALRVPVIHLLAREPATETSLADTCRTSLANIRDFLPKVAKRSTSSTDKWQLTDKSFREVDPWKFPYRTSSERQEAIDSAIKSFDRQRLTKDDKLWQILLPRDQRGQGICLSRSKVKAPEPKAKASTPMHKISDLTKKKPAAKKAEDKPVERKPRVAKEPEFKPKSIKEKYLEREKAAAAKKAKDVKEVKDDPKAATPNPASASQPGPSGSSTSQPSSTDPPKPRTKKAPAADSKSAPRARSKAAARDMQRERPVRPFKATMPVNTKPKNPSPLSASPPLNASDFEDSQPLRKKAAAPSTAKTSGSSDRGLKRKANDTGSDIHNHNLAVKKPQLERNTPNHTPSHTNGRLHGSTPSSSSSLKRKSDESSSSNTPTTTPKVRKVTTIDTGLASRYHHNNPQASPGASSSSTTTSTTSPSSIPSLSFRQTVELSQKFQKYYKKYEALYWELTEADKAPTEAQRGDLLKMHKKLEEMKREIKAGAGGRV